VGVDVELIRVAQRGTSPRRRRDTEVSVVGDSEDRLAAILMRVQHRGRTPMLARVGLYHDLELVSDDMLQLLGELDQLLAEVQNRAERDMVVEVKRLAEWCRDDRQLRLRFLGD
jgi:hypothetical protein